MDKRYSQLELFSAGREHEPVREEASRRPFIFRVNGYEKTLFLLIGFVVTGAVCYCLGVEHGKARALAKINAGFDLAARPAPVKRAEPVAAPVAVPKAVRLPNSATLPVAQSVPSAQAKAAVKKEAPQQQAGAFTIQIGTYRSVAAAKLEKDKLAKKGIPASIVKRGDYNLVVVGNFGDKETARSTLTRLRQNYRDCYIRRL